MRGWTEPVLPVPLTSPECRLLQLHLFKRCLVVAVAALHDPLLAVDDMEAGRHRLIVADALRIGALHKADQGLRKDHFLLLDNLIVTDDAEGHVRGDDGNLVELLVGEELVGHLDDGLAAHLAALEIVADRDRCLHLVEMKKAYDLEKLV